MNFKVTLAHHYAKQFDDPAVYNSILQNCDISAMFYTRSHDDRKQMATEFYGGDIGFEEAAFAAKTLQKQNAVIKIGKDNPVFTKIPNVDTPKVSREELRNYILELYRNPWYHDSDKINEPIRTQTKDSKPPKPRAKADSPPNRKPRLPDKGNQTDKWKAVSQNLPVSPEHADEDAGTEGS
jgi:hypothetical protein